ncbi:MAG: GntR family transcriptional regulator [Oscillospiraceae bacterium]|nr:GntR family transcriptional regulator [Oscillospiraceae bacterium]
MAESLKDKAYAVIKERILICEYEPLSFLDVGSIAEELNISRTPVRDAISLLEQEELVQIIPRHGVMVLGISSGLINDIISTRRIVEPYAARTAAVKADEVLMMKMRESFTRPNDVMAAIRLDQDLHRYIISCTENYYIINMMEKIFNNSFRIMLSGATMPGVFEQSNREHIAIIDAILERNPDKAEKQMLLHLSHAEETEYEAAGMLMRR